MSEINEQQKMCVCLDQRAHAPELIIVNIVTREQACAGDNNNIMSHGNGEKIKMR